MKDKDGITPEDKKAFSDAMSGVTPLKKIKNKKPCTKTGKNSHGQKNSAVNINPISLTLDYDLLAPIPGSVLLSRNKGVSKSVFNNLKEGLLPTRAELDLHQCRPNEAISLLNDFFDTLRQKNMHHAIIIHGKGRGIIKALVVEYLEKRTDVIAFHSTRQADGGTGALYVLRKA